MDMGLKLHMNTQPRGAPQRHAASPSRRPRDQKTTWVLVERRSRVHVEVWAHGERLGIHTEPIFVLGSVQLFQIASYFRLYDPASLLPILVLRGKKRQVRES